MDEGFLIELERMISTRPDVSEEDREHIVSVAKHFASLEYNRQDTHSLEETKKEFDEYLSMVNKIFDDDNSLDVCINSAFTFINGNCYHEVKNINSRGESQLLVFSVFFDDKEFRDGLLKPACVGYARRNPLDDTQVIVNPRQTNTYLVNSYSNDGNVLSVNNADSGLAREIFVNLQKIPATLYHDRSKPLEMKETTNGFTGFFGLALIVVSIAIFVGVLITIGILQ